MKIKINLETENNKKFLFDLSRSKEDDGLFFISSMASYGSLILRYYTYRVTDKHLFMLAVMKQGITFEIIEE
jgi:hypothetical protein